MRSLTLYLVLLVTFLAVDAVWLGLVADGFYGRQLGFLLAAQPNWLAAGVFYLLFVAGLQIFVVEPGLRTGSLRWTLGRAALFGLVTYATYDLTNLATVAGWPVLVTVVDLAWGTVLSGAVSLVGHLAGRRLRRA
ncbi:MAG: DUF2177 family protein [Candidatus Krumholzibacteriia bacterium]